MRLVTVIVPFAAIIGAGAFALLRPSSSSVIEKREAPAAGAMAGAEDEAPDPHGGALPPNHPPIGGANAGHGMDSPDPHGGALPANHPPLGAMGAQGGPTATDEAPAIRWTVPSDWQVAPNPNAMRIATYRIHAAASGGDDAEMSVARAGGTAEANIQRWLGQFDNAGPDTRAEKTVHGLHVTLVEVTGTYLGGGMTPGAGATPHSAWTLAAAIVETAGTPYFFKLVGPAATVHAAHAAFDALVASFTPT